MVACLKNGDILLWNTLYNWVETINGPDLEMSVNNRRKTVRKHYRSRSRTSFFRGSVEFASLFGYDHVTVSNNGNSILLFTQNHGIWVWIRQPKASDKVSFQFLSVVCTSWRWGKHHPALNLCWRPLHWSHTYQYLACALSKQNLPVIHTQGFEVPGTPSRFTRARTLSAQLSFEPSKLFAPRSERKAATKTTTSSKQSRVAWTNLPASELSASLADDRARLEGALCALHFCNSIDGSGWRITHIFFSSESGTPCLASEAKTISINDMIVNFSCGIWRMGSSSAKVHGTAHPYSTSTRSDSFEPMSLLSPASSIPSFRHAKGRSFYCIEDASNPVVRSLPRIVHPLSIHAGRPRSIIASWDKATVCLAVVVNTDDDQNTELLFFGLNSNESDSIINISEAAKKNYEEHSSQSYSCRSIKLQEGAIAAGTGGGISDITWIGGDHDSVGIFIGLISQTGQLMIVPRLSRPYQMSVWTHAGTDEAQNKSESQSVTSLTIEFPQKKIHSEEDFRPGRYSISSCNGSGAFLCCDGHSVVEFHTGYAYLPAFIRDLAGIGPAAAPHPILMDTLVDAWIMSLSCPGTVHVDELKHTLELIVDSIITTATQQTPCSSSYYLAVLTDCLSKKVLTWNTPHQTVFDAAIRLTRVLTSKMADLALLDSALSENEQVKAFHHAYDGLLIAQAGIQESWARQRRNGEGEFDFRAQWVALGTSIMTWMTQNDSRKPKRSGPKSMLKKRNSSSSKGTLGSRSIPSMNEDAQILVKAARNEESIRLMTGLRERVEDRVRRWGSEGVPWISWMETQRKREEETKEQEKNRRKNKNGGKQLQMCVRPTPLEEARRMYLTQRWANCKQALLAAGPSYTWAFLPVHFQTEVFARGCIFSLLIQFLRNRKYKLYGIFSHTYTLKHDYQMPMKLMMASVNDRYTFFATPFCRVLPKA